VLTQQGAAAAAAAALARETFRPMSSCAASPSVIKSDFDTDCMHEEEAEEEEEAEATTAEMVRPSRRGASPRKDKSSAAACP
jgi:hypothetical protein